MRTVSKKNSVGIRNTGSQAPRAVTVAVGMSGQRNKFQWRNKGNSFSNRGFLCNDASIIDLKVCTFSNSNGMPTNCIPLEIINNL